MMSENPSVFLSCIITFDPLIAKVELDFFKSLIVKAKSGFVIYIQNREISQ